MISLDDGDDISLGDRFVLRPRQGQLLDRAGQRLAIGERALALLGVLAEHAGKLTSKRTLFDGVWPDVVVEENNLQVQISALRKVLGSDAIATVPGRGYRLCLQVVHPREELRESLPPVAAPSEPADPPLPLVGRLSELRDLHRLIGTHSLVTLVGAGGVGKTRLARALHQHASDADGPDWAWVELASIVDGALVAPALLEALALQPAFDQSPQRTLADALRRRSVLIVLDNAEHLAAAVGEVVEIVRRAAPGVRFLVTSRQPLQLAAELVYRLEGLRLEELAPDLSLLPHDGAIGLFAMRAHAADAHFTLDKSNLGAVADLCRQLDGLPLAIEMAAARVPSLGVNGIRSQLGQHRELLTTRSRNVAGRHQTLRATLDWSHALLAPIERRTFRRLAIFSGGFTLEAASNVASQEAGDAWATCDALAGLIDKSMVVADGADPPRYRMLETVRAYGLQALAAAGEEQATRARHAIWCLAFFTAMDDEWWTRPTRAWIGETLPEMANLGAALAWALEEPGQASLGIRLAAAAGPMWQRIGREGSSEARTLMARALALADAHTDPAILARLYHLRGVYCMGVDARESLAWMRRGADLSASSVSPRDRGEMLVACGRAMVHVGEREAALRMLDLAQEPCDLARVPRLEGLLSLGRGFVLKQQASGEARHHFEHAVSLFDRTHADRLATSARNDLADCVWAEGDVDMAAALLREVVENARAAPPGLAELTGVPQLNLAGIHAERGQLDQAGSWARQARPLLERAESLWAAYDVLSLIVARRGDLEGAAQLQGMSDASYAGAGVTAREPNERRIHANVAALLDAGLDAEARRAAYTHGCQLDADSAWALALG